MRTWMAIATLLQLVILLVSCNYVVHSFRLLRLPVFSVVGATLGIMASSIVVHVLLFLQVTGDAPMIWHAWVTLAATLLGTLLCFWMARSIWIGLERLKGSRSRGIEDIQELTRRIFR